jgi:hypothetical protein
MSTISIAKHRPDAVDLAPVDIGRRRAMRRHAPLEPGAYRTG